jgi:hypothetical protein
MKRYALWGSLVAMALVLLLAGIVIGAEKTYQFTGTVKTVEGTTFTVEKSAQEIWTFSTDSATKGAPKVGDKVTVFYKMIATQIEAKPAATAKPPKK